MKDRFKNLSDRERMHRYGAEAVDGGMPVDFRQPPRQHLGKVELHEMLARAVANTASIKVERVQPNKARR
jgi:hypothetical protein